MPPASDAAPMINPPCEALRLDLENPRLRLRIPSEIQDLKSRDPVAARDWREQTRSAFEAYIRRGYEVRELIRGDDGSRYLLSHAE